MSADLKKRMGDLLQEVRENGWSAANNNKHVKVRGRETMVVLPQTPSDYRSVENARAELRRAGYLEQNPTKLRALDRAKPKGVPQELRTRMKKLLNELGERNGNAHQKGQKGGARAVLVEKMTEVWLREGITPPASESYFFSLIKDVAEGKVLMSEEKTTMVSIAVNELLALQAGKNGTPYQGVRDGRVQTLWQCKHCKKEFPGQTSLSLHIRKAHPEMETYAVVEPKKAEEPVWTGDPAIQEAKHQEARQAIRDAAATAPPEIEALSDATADEQVEVAPQPVKQKPLRELLSVQILEALLKSPIGRERAYKLAEQVQELEQA